MPVNLKSSSVELQPSGSEHPALTSAHVPASVIHTTAVVAAIMPVKVFYIMRMHSFIGSSSAILCCCMHITRVMDKLRCQVPTPEFPKV